MGLIYLVALKVFWNSTQNKRACYCEHGEPSFDVWLKHQ